MWVLPTNLSDAGVQYGHTVVVARGFASILMSLYSSCTLVSIPQSSPVSASLQTFTDQHSNMDNFTSTVCKCRTGSEQGTLHLHSWCYSFMSIFVLCKCRRGTQTHTTEKTCARRKCNIFVAHSGRVRLQTCLLNVLWYNVDVLHRKVWRGTSKMCQTFLPIDAKRNPGSGYITAPLCERLAYSTGWSTLWLIHSSLPICVFWVRRSEHPAEGAISNSTAYITFHPSVQ